MISSIITSIIKPYIAGVMSLTMAVTSTLPGAVGDYAKLQQKAMETNPAKSEIVINLAIDIDAIETAVGEEIVPEDFAIPGMLEDGKLNVSGTIYTYTDMENTSIAISFGGELEDGKAIYLDEEGVAITADVVDTVLNAMTLFGDESSVKTYEVYKKYFDGNGMYISWQELFGIGELEADEEVTAILDFVEVAIDDLFAILTTEENVKAFGEIYNPIYGALTDLYTVDTVDGVKTYSCKMTGMDLIEYSTEVLEVMYSEETAGKIIDFVTDIADDIDYIKYIDMVEQIEGDLELPEGITNEMITAVVVGYIEQYRADFVADYSSVGTEDITIFDVILTGKDESGEYAELVEILPVLTPFLENSYAESGIYEKNGVVTENSKIVINDGKAEYLSFEVITGVEKYDGVLPAAKDVVPFDMRVEAVEIENKLGYEDALEKGVQSVEISWNSYMYPDENQLHISYPYFYVTYNTKMLDSIISNPEFEAMDEEYKQAVIEMYENEYEMRYCDTTAHLIDNSVYLPLRQLMENAGYEVSWDGEARKAYVTVGGVKIEMTGTIINDRTYVKVRDFEKLGATVEYSEDFYYEDAYNDFDKDCRAVIIFAK
ncbi:MAG: copper amine oxidase N-terminal domain-containing protein [Clostridia bacterium]|nr:copper amine oxidase N-terminal domain-containing protein [Clostridia bacterium]